MNSHPDWNRILADSDHRWAMGLARYDSTENYFAVEDAAVLDERSQLLTQDFGLYADMQPGCEPFLEETLEFAKSIGTRLTAHESTGRDGLRALGESWEPDFVWMVPGADGIHRLVGGVVCFPSSWALGDKLGRPMSEVHDPVPGLNDSLGRQIETFLRKLEPAVVWRRENWGLSRDANRNHHTSKHRRRLDATVTADEVWVRLEHQMLLKLPRTQAVLFGIRVEIVPLKDVIAIPHAAARMARLLATMSESAATYKGLLSSRETIVKLLVGESATLSYFAR